MRQVSPEKPTTFFDYNRYPSTSQLQQLFNSSLDIICSIDFSGRFVHMSEACRKTLGYAPEEMIGQCVASFLHEEDIEKTVAIGDAIIRGKDKQNFENRYRKTDGSFVTLNWSCHWDSREALMFCIGRDVSERKEKEQLQARFELKIKEQNRQLNEILDRITDGFFAMDQEWRILYANRQTEAILSIQKDAYLSLNFWECFPQMVGTAYFEQYHKAMHEGVAVHFEAYFPPFDAWFAIDAYPSETGLSVFFRDISERIKADEQRRRTESELQKLSLIAKKTTNAVSLVELDSTISWINEAYTKIFGYTADEAIGRKNSDLLHGQQPEQRVLAKFKRCFQNGKPFKGEIAGNTKDGELRWLDTIGQPMFDADGMLKSYFVIQTDITERKQVQEALLQSNERFRLAAKTDAIYDWDLADNHLFWGEGLAEIFGYAPGELQISQWKDALHPEEQDGLIADLYQTLTNTAASVWKKEYRMRKKDGAYCYVFERGHILRDEHGNAVRMVGVMQNITERKEAEEQLSKLSLVARETGNAVFVTDTHHRIVWINDAFSKLFEYTFEEVNGKLANELLDCPEADAYTLTEMNKKAFGCEGFHVQVLNRTKTGKRKWCESNYQPVRNKKGEIIQHFCIITDITQRKALEEELEQQRRQTTTAIIQAQEQERAAVGCELHDNVNQILTSIKFYQELVLTGRGNTDELVQKSIEMLMEAIEENRKLSKRLSAPSIGDIGLTEAVQELIDTVAATRKFQLLFKPGDYDANTVSKELRLTVYRILQEHLTNVSKYANAALVEVSLGKLKNCLVLEVKDNGIGFDPKERHCGIGISNMRMRAESHDGQLIIESSPGEGCRMRAWFPLSGNNCDN